MDYRSPEAAFINNAFMRRQMQPLVVEGTDRVWGFLHTAQNSVYSRTNEDRFVRVDITNLEQATGLLNVLSADRQSFDPAVGIPLVPGERIDRTHPFSRYDLVPRQTNMQFVRHDLMPRVALIGVSLVTGSIIGYGIRWVIGSHGILAQTATSASGAIAGTHIGLGGSHHVHEQQALDSAHEFDAGRNGDVPHDHVDPGFHAAHHTHQHHEDSTPVGSGWQTVPGSPERLEIAPNGSLLDGTPESAGQAMLPSPRAEAYDTQHAHNINAWSAAGDAMPVGGVDWPPTAAFDDAPGTHVPHDITLAEGAVFGIVGGVITYCVAENAVIPAARAGASAARRRYAAWQDRRPASERNNQPRSFILRSQSTPLAAMATEAAAPDAQAEAESNR